MLIAKTLHRQMKMNKIFGPSLQPLEEVDCQK